MSKGSPGTGMWPILGAWNRLRQLKAIQLHRVSAAGQSIRGISAASDDTRAIFQQLDLPLPETSRL